MIGVGNAEIEPSRILTEVMIEAGYSAAKVSLAIHGATKRG
jgi:hypothetical protein